MTGHQSLPVLCALALGVFSGPLLVAQAAPPASAPPAAGSAASVTAPKVPTVTAPAVTAPVVTAPAGTAAAPTFNTSVQKAAAIAVPYDEATFKTAMTAGTSILLLFSGAADTIWLQQGPVLQTVLKEPEFKQVLALQIDATNTDLMGRYAVSVPGTLLVMKGGFERIRSTRMVKADVIRKMLRLQSAL